MTTTTATIWKYPPMDTTYWLEDGRVMTLQEIFDDLGYANLPGFEDEFEEMLFAYGAWESEEAMREALANRIYERNLGKGIGFREV